MESSETNVIPLMPEVLLRVMLYNDSTRRSTTQLAPDAWVDFDTAFGPTFQAGTEHQVSLVNTNRKPVSYKVVVANPPLLEQGTHPDDSGKIIPIAKLYLMPAA